MKVRQSQEVVIAGYKRVQPAVTVNYATADGTAVRDYTHVMDLARAHLAALEAALAECGDREAT